MRILFSTFCLAAFTAAAASNDVADQTDFVNVIFAPWCYGNSATCPLRLFADVGGVLCLLDSGSSTLAFCAAPPDVTDSLRAEAFYANGTRVPDGAISQCALHGSGRGFYGDTFSGNVGVSNRGGLDGVYYTVLDKRVGEDGNDCGRSVAISAGLTRPVGGLWGVASSRLNGAVSGAAMAGSAATWDPVADGGTCDRDAGQCRCPTPGLDVRVPDSLLERLAREGEKQWALGWSGEVGAGSGQMLFGDPAQATIPPDAPRWPLDFASGSYRFEVTGVKVAGTRVPQDVPLTYIFDIGSPSISIPQDVADALGEARSAVVEFELLSSAGAAVAIPVTLTKDLLDAGEFRVVAPGSTHFFGLPIMRYFDNVVLHFEEGNTHFQGIPKGRPILDVFGQPETESWNAGSYRTSQRGVLVSIAVAATLVVWVL